MMTTMTNTNVEKDTNWYFSGKLVKGPKIVALGRRNWYSIFAQKLSNELSTQVYLYDFMTWIDERQPRKSLFYFIKTSDLIYVNLKGITKEQLHRATAGAHKKAETIDDIGTYYMSLWEINQIYFGGFLEKTYWYTADSMTKNECYEALGRKVHKSKIMEDNRLNNIIKGENIMGSVSLPSVGSAIEYYTNHFAGTPEIIHLLREIEKQPWTDRIRLNDAYGVLIISLFENPKKNKHLKSYEIIYNNENHYIVQEHSANFEVTFWDRKMTIDEIMNLLCVWEV